MISSHRPAVSRLPARATCMLAIALASGAHALAAQTVRNTSYTATSGERVLRHEADVDAPSAVVWKTLTTAEGLRSFLAPVVALDFRVGGRLETSYSAQAHVGDPGNIVSEVVAYVPDEMFVTRIVQTPPGFAHPEIAKALHTVYDIRPLSASTTRVIVSMVGWQSGGAADTVYRFFERGNAYTMGELLHRLTTRER